MGDKSKIEWTQATWNPVSGCSKVSPGCANCYAEALTKRYAGRPGWPAEFKPWTPENAPENVVLHPDKLDLPLHWKKPRRVFVNSMSDLFHEAVPDEFVRDVFNVMACCPQHTFQVLTKRPYSMYRHVNEWLRFQDGTESPAGTVQPLPNIWLGVSVENQHWADIRIDELRRTPAAVHFLSCEPLLAPLVLDLDGIQWVVVGGESGPKRREMNLDWARSLRDQCRAAGVAYFFKQAGGAWPGMPSGDPDLDGCKEMPR